MTMPTTSPAQIEYPDSDGQPMAENTLQFRWILTIEGNLDALFADNPNVFVADDLLWYPVQGQPTIRIAPDAMVVFGRPKGDRGSYRQWVEEGIAPQVVFEIQSPSNRPDELDRKFEFYEHYGVEEYYLYNPEDNELVGWRRQEGNLQPVVPMHGWVSPLLKIRFDRSEGELVLYGPDGQRFRTFVELMQEKEEAQQQRRSIAPGRPRPPSPRTSPTPRRPGTATRRTRTATRRTRATSLGRGAKTCRGPGPPPPRTGG